MRFTVDSNILIYAFDQDNLDKHAIAVDLMRRLSFGDFVVTTQVLGEFLSVMRRKYSDHMAAAVAQVRAIADVVEPLVTTVPNLLDAAAISYRHKLQFWDSVIIAVARSAGAEAMVTEDMQDGAVIAGVTLLNPFNPANHAQIDAMLPA